MGQTIASLLADLRSRFDASQVAQPETDARLLVCELMGISLTDLILGGERIVDDGDAKRILAAAHRRCLGEPVHRILGHRWFYGIDLHLSPATLEPRPDTETLVEAALPLAKKVVGKKPICNILDLGTGSGAIALAILAEIQDAVAIVSDISGDALDAAQQNAQMNGLQDRISTCRSNWFEAIDGSFDLIVSNPPYIRSADIAALSREVKEYDPLLALDGGADGLDAYRAIAEGAGRHLADGGSVLLETGFDQHEDVIEIFRGASFSCLSRMKDLGGNDRVLVFCRTA